MITTKNKPIAGTDNIFRGIVVNHAWSLCVGAGISVGLVPTWQELTRKVLNDSFTTNYDKNKFDELVQDTRWGLDALLQGAANNLQLQGKTASEFENLLEKYIYEDMLIKAKKHGVEDALVEALNNPRLLKKDQILLLCDYFITHYGSSTLVQLAQRLSAIKEKGKPPHSVINFNADTLLYAVLDLFLIKEHFESTGTFEHPKTTYQKTLRGVDSGNHGVTSIFHCHGAIAPKSKKSKAKKHKDSREQLIFSEQDYLEVANNASTWAQSLFLFHAQSTRLLIIGHSMSDPNIRKWLAWSHENSMKDISQLANSGEITPRHIWVTVEPKDRNQKTIQEVSLLHVGVRICWIKEWKDIGSVLDNLLAL